MKKRVLFGILIISLLLVSFAMADENDTVTIDDSDDELDRVDKAYECLENKVDGKCSSLSLEEKIFTSLAIGECDSEISSDSLNNECWPKSGCKIKSTAQAVLALSESGSSTDDAETWLLDQKTIPEDVVWYLQIESSEATTCSISYSGASHSISIAENKKLNSGAGTCLSRSEGDYWLRVAPNCQDKEFSVSCDKSFLTNLLYKKRTSPTIYVSGKTNSASAEGSTTEKINSFCFSQGSVCDYEGTLWATMVLDYVGQDMSEFLPYLVTMADENTEYLPEAFIYLLTGYTDFRSDLLLKQKGNFWDESGEKFYDTAVALFPFQYEEPQEKTTAKEWLLEEGVQDNDGCWKGNTRNTAFLLYSVWPKDVQTDDDVDCEDAGYFCMSEIDCDGNVLEGYGCSGVFKCCDSQKTIDTCTEQSGDICNSGESCAGGTTLEASNTGLGESCCVGGSCQVPQTETECEQNFGVCRSFGCDNDEEEANYDCDSSGDSCCVQKSTSGKSYFWIWILVILIVLVVLGIIFRNTLRRFWFRMKSKFKKSKPPRPGMFPGRRPMQRPPQRRQMQRRIAPSPRRPLKRPQARKPKQSGEFEDILKKLKDMGK
jgi:hypothetical protein